MGKRDWMETTLENEGRTWDYLLYYITLPNEENIKEGMKLPIQLLSMIAKGNDSRPECFYERLPQNIRILKYENIGEITIKNKSNELS